MLQLDEAVADGACPEDAGGLEDEVEEDEGGEDRG